MEHFDKVADKWNNKVWAKDEAFANDIVEFCRLKGDELTLYVGVGTGDMAKHFRVKDIIGLDTSKNMLSENKLLPRHRLVVGDANNIPYLDDTFDFVFARNLLKHVISPINVIREMKRVLKPDGKLITIESCVLSLRDKEYPNFCVRTIEPNHHSFMIIEEITSLFIKAGFNVVTNNAYTYRSKWLKKWIESSKASKEIQKKILQKYKEANDGFKRRQKVVFTKDDDIESNIYWSFCKGIK